MHVFVVFAVLRSRQFIYGGEGAIAVTSGNAADLLRASKSLRVDGLDEQVRDYVRHSLTHVEAFDVLEAATDAAVPDIAEVSPRSDGGVARSRRGGVQLSTVCIPARLAFAVPVVPWTTPAFNPDGDALRV